MTTGVADVELDGPVGTLLAGSTGVAVLDTTAPDFGGRIAGRATSTALPRYASGLVNIIFSAVRANWTSFS